MVEGGARLRERSLHLRRLEAESIAILREVVAEFKKPVLLYSSGKGSSVALHLALKAFYPTKPAFPLLHIDTGWKFREMIAFRDRTARELGLELLVHLNEEGRARGINPIASDPALYTRVMKTQALKHALDRYGFDAALSGARRNEEKGRAKERIFSLRARDHTWSPHLERPELWRLYNTCLAPGETMRVFPLSNWTERDIWEYIAVEGIGVVPLYFAAPRAVVDRAGALIMVEDERLPLLCGEEPQRKSVRFRALGCYPLTAAMESTAASVAEIIAELERMRGSERAAWLPDGNEDGARERQNREGYF
jgi:sulfate adenylyltransferase subunit 2